MRYKYFISIIVTLFVLLVFIVKESTGKISSDIDSLINLISIQANDTAKVNTLIILTRESSKTDIALASEYCDQAYRLAIDLDFASGISGSLHEKGRIYWKMGQLDTAIYLVSRAININDSLKNLRQLANAYNTFGNLLLYNQLPDTALVYIKRSNALYQSIGDSIGMARTLNSFGIIYKSIAAYDSAAFYYIKYLQLNEEIGFLEGMSAGLINLGKVYYLNKEYAKAKINYINSIEYAKKFNRLKHISLAYTNLGMVARAEKKLDEALNYYQKSIEINKELNNLSGLAATYMNIGNIYFEREDYSKANDFYESALAIYTGMGYTKAMMDVMVNQGVVFARKNDYLKALNIYKRGLELATEIDDLYGVRNISYNIFKVYELMGDYTQAFEYQTKYYSVNDSIFNLEKAEVIADLTLEYEKEKDQARILILENEDLAKDLSLRKRTNQRNIYLFSGTGTIVVILFLFLFYRHKTRKDNIITEQRIQQLEEEKKLLAAKFLVEGQEEERKRIAKELHDGLGVLLSTAKMQFATIKDKSPENKPLIDKATKLLEQATGDVREISHNMMPGLLTKFGLYEATEDLFDKLNETSGLKAIIEIKGEQTRLQENKEIMLYRIIQEMVNNTLKHAEAKNILLDMNIQSETLNIKYSDDGKGFVVSEKLESKSFGLTSIQSRVSFLNGQVKIESIPGTGTSYFIKVPI